MRKVYIEKAENIIENTNLLKFITYTDSEMKTISLKAWSLLSQILITEYQLDIEKEIIIYNKYKKPYIKNSNIYFNISHSKNLIAIVIDNKECGIDIEYIDYKRDIDKLKHKVLSNKELKIYNSVKDKHKYFYKMWTKKEAYYKTIGTGIIVSELSQEQKLSNTRSYIYIDKKDKYYISTTK